MQFEDKFYSGIVVDNNDEFRRGRVKIRVDGVHDNFSDDTLPWAEVIYPSMFGLFGGTGSFAVLQKGTGVWVKFDSDFWHPIVLGVMVGGTEEHTDFFDSKPPFEKRKGSSDVSTEAIPKENVFQTSGSHLKHKVKGIDKEIHQGKYLTSSVIETPSGHKIMFDDSLGSNEITITHSTGHSTIKFDRFGGITIAADNINFDAFENITFRARTGHIDLSAKDQITVNSEKDISFKSQGNFGVLSDKKIEMSSKDSNVLQSQDGDFLIHANKGCFKAECKKELNILASGGGLIEAKDKLVAQCNNGSLELGNSAVLASRTGDVSIHGNSCNVNTRLDVNGMSCLNGLTMCSNFMMAKDFVNSYSAGSVTSSLNESLNETGKEFVSELKTDFNRLKSIENTEERKTEFEAVQKKVNEFNGFLYNKTKEIKKSLLNDFVKEHIDSFGGIDESEIEFLTESINGPITVEPRNPNGEAKTKPKNNCKCDWTSPDSWFEIDEIHWPQWEDFENMLTFNITWPDLTKLLPMVPKVSLSAVVGVIAKIVAKKVIKLMSVFRRMIMKFLRPILDMINSIIGIINQIPPKITINLDFANMIKVPLFEFPSLPDGGAVPNWCNVNQCSCSCCQDKVNEFVSKTEDKAKEFFGDNDNVTEKVLPNPNGVEKTV